jgi:hypothetical protein
MGAFIKIICISSRISKGEMMILHAPSTQRLGWIAKEINDVFTKR